MHNMPMLADILYYYPDAKIDWVVEEAYADVISLNPHVRNVIPFALRRWRKNIFSVATIREIREFSQALRRESYDYIFDTQGLLKTGIVMALAQIIDGGRKVGLANGTEGSGYEGISRIFHTQSVPVNLHTHAVLRGRLVAATALGYSVDNPPDFSINTPDIFPAWMPDSQYAVFFHGTARDAKKWSLQNWIKIGRFITDKKLPILLPWGTESEKQDAKELSLQIPGSYVLPQLPILEAVLLAAHARLVIGVDTGLTHIAAAFSRPTVELYSDSPKWKTQGDWSSSIINLGDQGRPADVNEVKVAIDSLLSSPNKQSDRI